MTRAVLLAVFLLLLITPAVIRRCAATERLKQAERVEAAAQGALFAQACDAETSGRGGWGDCFRRKLVENGYRLPVSERGEPGREGATENGVFGTYSSYWTRERGWRKVFVPHPGAFGRTGPAGSSSYRGAP